MPDGLEGFDLNAFLNQLLGQLNAAPQGNLFSHPLFGEAAGMSFDPTGFATQGTDPLGLLTGGGDLGDREYQLSIIELLAGLSEGALDRDVRRAQIAASGAGAGAARYSADLQYALGQAQLAETIRANKAAELESNRRRALEAASGALAGFLESQSLADARRLAGLQETRALLPSLVDPNREFFVSPTGPLATSMRRMGLPFEPTRIQHRELAPALSLAMGAAAGNRDITDAIEQLRSAGNA
jgi:hypothetical protein